MNYHGKEFRYATEKEIDIQLENFWLIETASNLGVISLINVIDTSGSEIARDHKKVIAYFDRWNPPYSVMKSMTSNVLLSFEQGKEPHYDRGDLPIVAISASGVVSDDSPGFGGVSSKDAQRIFKEMHKDLAELSTHRRHVVVNGTNHVSVVYNDEIADHILSLIPLIDKKIR